MTTTRQLRTAETLEYLQRQLAHAEQMKREAYGIRKVDKALDRAIHKLKRKIKRLKP
jgi:hypothetical protein